MFIFIGKNILLGFRISKEKRAAPAVVKKARLWHILFRKERMVKLKLDVFMMN